MTHQPAYLTGALAPVPDEIDATALAVTGELPAALTGRYFRNGPNPKPGDDPGHWFAGAGMIHGVRLRDGRAEWYRNRWVRTRAFTEDARHVDEHGTVDRTAVPANTHVIRHAGTIFALVENGFPYQMTPELDTVGSCDFGGRLTTAMTAHPKEDPATGELHFFGYGFTAPYLTYHRLSAAGELVESRPIDVPGPTMVHDFAVTENHVIWLDLPVVFDMDLVGQGMPYRWDDSYGARLGVMDRAGRVTWFDVDPCYVFHTGNAWEDPAGRIVLDAVRYSPEAFTGIWTRIAGAADPVTRTGGAVLHRWILDPASGAVKEEQLDDRTVEFPTLDDRRLGRAGRYLYTVGRSELVKYDTVTGAAHVRELGARPGEAVFVPAPGARGEDEGWLLSIVTHQDAAELLVLDAGGLDTVASVHLPRRVPAGFHGSWLPDPAG
ncbi:carotenoid cleavage dioxygenase [Sphaerisporangium rufum]|uniref:Dioxygenase n=1 Tax=Sphaerisporangium rufum TaxID=1381558 RepID=A0A919V3E0_9ACTN|nr:carotenoid oxygenase family protein [Sphaerisporangium rufum]GII80712.1 carotenoid cleavage dioxygenase [Sphaerisporangium rufum]